MLSQRHAVERAHALVVGIYSRRWLVCVCACWYNLNTTKQAHVTFCVKHHVATTTAMMMEKAQPALAVVLKLQKLSGTPRDRPAGCLSWLITVGGAVKVRKRVSENEVVSDKSELSSRVSAVEHTRAGEFVNTSYHKKQRW